MQLDESRFEIEDLKDEMTKAQESLQRKVENVSNLKKKTHKKCASFPYVFVTMFVTVFVTYRGDATVLSPPLFLSLFLFVVLF